MSILEHKIVDIVNVIFDNEMSLLDMAAGSSHEDLLTGDFDEYFLKNLFKKAENLDLDVDPKQAALDDFNSFLIEQNTKVVEVQAVLDNLDSSPVLKRILLEGKRLFEVMFHDFHPTVIKPRFTLGSTLSLPKNSSIFARVKASEGHKTLEKNFAALYPYSDTLLESYPHTAGDDSNYVKVNVVGKTALIGRIIGSPPSSMLAFQCGMGDYFERKLVKFCKINLKTAQELHRFLAMENSLDGAFSTMDQRKASDNILKIFAMFMVPKSVGDYMSAISPSTLQIEGKFVHTHMLCAAGNGFNTGFQTLLFWVLIKAIQKEVGVKQHVYVYGDDVILHNSVYDSVCKVFPLLGLEINQGKSFKEGPFRESCGGDYLYGNNVRAFYASTVPQTTIDWIRFVNGIRRVGYYNNADTWRSSGIHRLWFWCVLHIEPKDRIFCPLHYGDAGINTEDCLLYDLGQPIRWDRERKTEYPGNGYDHEGRPYGSERIRIYVSGTSGDKSTFAEESKGLPERTVLRLITQSSVKHSGLSLRKRRGNNEKELRYPAVYGGEFDSYKTQYVPYTLTGQAPENIDALFDLIQEGKGSRITNSDYVVARYELKRLSLISELMALLQLTAEKQMVIADRSIQKIKELKL